MQRKKLSLVTDVPMQMRVEQVYGTECSSKVNGVEYRYNVTGEDDAPALIYLTSDGRDALLRAEPQVGDWIEVLKRRRGNQYVFSVARLSDASEPRPAPQPPSAPAPIPVPLPINGNGHAHTALVAPRPPMQLVAPRPANLQPISQADPPRPEARDISARAQQLAGCLLVSFDAWEELRRHAEGKGVGITYTSEDVRCFATTYFINAIESRR